MAREIDPTTALLTIPRIKVETEILVSIGAGRNVLGQLRQGLRKRLR